MATEMPIQKTPDHSQVDDKPTSLEPILFSLRPMLCRSLLRLRVKSANADIGHVLLTSHSRIGLNDRPLKVTSKAGPTNRRAARQSHFVPE
jgi:hypothetical protein